MEFWNDEATNKSWKDLIELHHKIKFVLIGGCQIYTKLHKSKDIDIIIDYDTLGHLQSLNYIINKNERLKKYEIKLLDDIDIDIYLPSYSHFLIPIKDIINKSIIYKGFKIPNQEMLLILKLDAFQDRQNTTKGIKDSIDILGLLFYSDINLRLLKKYSSDYNIEWVMKLALKILMDFDLQFVKYLNLDLHTFSKLKKKYVENITNLL